MKKRVSKRTHVEWGTWQHDSASEKEVLRAIQFLQLPFLAWGLNVALLPLEVLLFWGVWQPTGNGAFSLAAMAYAGVLAVKGWKPWKMPLYRTFADGDSERWDSNPMAARVAEFLASRRIRWTGAAIISSSALTPWIISGASRLVGGSPLRHNAHLGLHPFAMLIVGYADALRMGTLAAVWMTAELGKNWQRLRHEAATTT